MRPQAASRPARENKAKTLHQQTLAPSLLHDNCPDDPELAAVVAAWPRLPEAIRAGIMAMMSAALKQ
jgi:hypothetical protein